MKKPRKRNQETKPGDKFGMLTIINEIAPHVNNCREYRMVLCLCDCGNKTKIRLASITCGQTKSCGCERVRFAKTLAITIHGLCEHPLYSIWEGMIQRCYNLKHPSSDRDGKIGVIICKAWRHNFKAFYDWAIKNGWREGLQIDKDKLSPTKPGKIYAPDFCCFLTQKENNRNKEKTIYVTFNEIKYSLAEACEVVGLTYNTVSARMRAGLTFDESISEDYKPKPPNYIKRTERKMQKLALLSEQTSCS